MNLNEAVLANGNVLYVLPYSKASGSVKHLVRYFSQRGIQVRVRVRDTIPKAAADLGAAISWGNPSNGQIHAGLNGGDVPGEGPVTRRAVSKITCLNLLRSGGVRAPEYTNIAEIAQQWLLSGDSVVARHTVTAHSGRGIQIVSPEGTVYKCPSVTSPWYSARLFTKYVKKKEEYRVFSVGGSVALVYKKGMRHAQDENSRSFMVRSWDNGWNFCRVELSEVPEDVLAQGVAAVSALGLHFGAADVGWNEYHQQATVYEVNTAPGIEGGTVEVLGDALLRCSLRPPVRTTVGTPVDADTVITRSPRDHLNDALRFFIR